MKKILFFFLMMTTGLTAALAQNSAAYDAGYSIGYFIGQFLPFIFLAVVGYLIYRFVRKRKAS
jgi:hypothetical protein